MTKESGAIQLSHLEQTIYFASQRWGVHLLDADLTTDLAKFLLGKPYPKAREATLDGIEHPLARLMEGLPISAEARAMTHEDIKLLGLMRLRRIPLPERRKLAHRGWARLHNLDGWRA